MSSKSARRRKRKAKQNNNNNKHPQQSKIDHNTIKYNDLNYGDKFKIIEQPIKRHNILMHGYLRTNSSSMHANIPMEIIKLCLDYFLITKLTEVELEIIDNNLWSIIKIEYDQSKPNLSERFIESNAAKRKYKKQIQRINDKINEWLEKRKNNQLKVENCVFKMEDAFNDLSAYQKGLICQRLLLQRKYPVHSLKVWPIECDDDKIKINLISEQLYFIEYLFYKRHDTLISVDLSEMNYNDHNLLYLLNAMENVTKYTSKKKSQKVQQERAIKNGNGNLKSSKQRPNKLEKDDFERKEDTTPKFSKNRKAQAEIERQLKKAREQKVKGKIHVDIKYKMQSMNLSYNNISDKHVALLLRVIKRCMPNMRKLDLSGTNVTNKSLQVIMKYNISRMQIELSACKGVTLKGLNKYARINYDNQEIEKYVYCKGMVYFANENEEGKWVANDRSGANYTRGKGKKLRGNRKRAIYTGGDFWETGYPSDW